MPKETELERIFFRASPKFKRRTIPQSEIEEANRKSDEIYRKRIAMHVGKNKVEKKQRERERAKERVTVISNSAAVDLVDGDRRPPRNDGVEGGGSDGERERRERIWRWETNGAFIYKMREHRRERNSVTRVPFY